MHCRYGSRSPGWLFADALGTSALVCNPNTATKCTVPPVLGLLLTVESRHNDALTTQTDIRRRLGVSDGGPLNEMDIVQLFGGSGQMPPAVTSSPKPGLDAIHALIQW